MLPRFESLCDPAKLYLGLVLVSIIFSLFNGFPFVAALVKVLFALFWTFVLNWLCDKGYKSVSWFFVLLPFIMIGLTFLGIMKIKKYYS
jgi:hypothetical protein